MKAKYHQWKGTRTGYGSGAGDLRKTQMTHPVARAIGKGNADPGVIGVRGAAGPPGKDGTQGPMGPVGPRGFPGRDGLSTTMGPLTSTGLGVPLSLMLI